MASKQITPFSIADILKENTTQDELPDDNLDKDSRNGDNRKQKLGDIKKRKHRDDDDEDKKERMIDKLRMPDGILGTEQKRRLEEQAKRKQAERIKSYAKEVKQLYIKQVYKASK